MEAFWAKGYEATSMADLCNCTGLHKGSLYQAFGDKRALFLAVLDRYIAHASDTFEPLAAVDGRDALDAIGALLVGAVGMACPRVGPGGCMAVNTRVELGPHDETVRDRIEGHFAALRAVITDALRRGQAAGVVRADRAPVAMAQVLEVALIGLTTTGRAGEPVDVEGLVGILLDGLRPQAR